jgi:NADPH2 dehydrogenase
LTTLFSEIEIRKVKIKNRIVLPPMVCFGYGGEDGKVYAKNLRHYEARAKGGAGLIIIEATCVSRNGRLSPAQLGLWSDDHVEGFSRLAALCHRHEAAVLVQIHHAGLALGPGVNAEALAPSEFHGRSMFGHELSARAITVSEIKAIEDDFVAAALRAQKAGLDGIELHGAHGYLISQFLSPLVNKRTDAYGGSLIKRTRLVREIIAGIRKAAGEEFIIGCRMGCNEPDLESSTEIARQIEKAGADLLHISTGADNIVNPQGAVTPPTPEGFPANWIVYGGTQIKKAVNVPVIVVNSIKTPDQAAYLVENGLADFVAIGKGMMVDPEWANKARTKLEVTPCLDCKHCSLFRPGAVCPQMTPETK